MFARGTYGLDDAATVDYGAAVAAGARYFFRYSAGVGDSGVGSVFKLMRDGELAEILGAGGDLIANFEFAGDTPTMGAAEGTACGSADLGFWKSKGLAQGSSIYVSWEPGNNAGQWPQVQAFLQAYNAALGGYYVADGMYASIDTLKHFAGLGMIKHGWLPESVIAMGVPKLTMVSLGLNAPPAVTNWDLLYQPTKSQLPIAMAYLDGLVAGSGLESIIWQNGNKWKNGADEDVVLLSGPVGSHLEAAGNPSPIINPTPPPPPPPVIKHGPMYQHAVPALIARGTNNYFGDIDGPAAEHGGINTTERNLIRLIQQQLIYLGFVPGVTNINSSWADGIFNTKDGHIGGPTTDAVTRFQKKYMPGTTFYGEVWWDDWTKLATF